LSAWGHYFEFRIAVSEIKRLYAFIIFNLIF
jgi:hypothetical protein